VRQMSVPDCRPCGAGTAVPAHRQLPTDTDLCKACRYDTHSKSTMRRFVSFYNAKPRTEYTFNNLSINNL
ncbi:MAG: hypothetical protein WC328_10250, partial [Kiritimatiellia bacterium]